MSTSSLLVTNGTGASVRSQLNAALAALVTQSLSATEPSPTYPLQPWADSTTGKIKYRNAGNTGWTIVGSFSAGGVALGNGTVANVLAYGATGDGTTDDTAAIQAAIDENDSVYFPRPTVYYRIRATLDVVGMESGNNRPRLLFGDGGASILYFDPTGNDIMFDIKAETAANETQFIVIRDFGIACAYPTSHTKTMFQLSDASMVLLENIVSVNDSWTGNGSIGFNFRGRDNHVIRKCYISADYPVRIRANPNSPTWQHDGFSYEAVTLKVLTSANYAVTCDPDVNLSQVSFKNMFTLAGKGGIYINNTSATAQSSMVSLENVRFEIGPDSGGDAGGWGVYANFDGGVSNVPCGNMRLSEVSVNSPDSNGFYFNGVASLQLTNANAGFDPYGIALQCEKVDSLTLTSFGVGEVSSQVILTDMFSHYVEYYNNYPANISINRGFYSRWDTDHPSRNWVFTNGVRKWSRRDTQGNGGTISLPSTVAGESYLVKVTCDAGYLLAFINYADAPTIISMGLDTGAWGTQGNGTFSITTSPSGTHVITNVSGGTQTFMIDVT